MMLIFMFTVPFAWGGVGGVGWGGANNLQSSTFFDSPSCASHSNFQHALASML